MPLDRTDAILDLSDPNIVVGPRKRHTTKHVLENGDPLAHKKVRKESAAVTVSSDAPSHMENPTVSSMPPPTESTPRPTRPTLATRPSNMHAAVSADSDEGASESSDGARAIVVEDSDENAATDEDDDAELCT
jgi:hypothetical protein